MVSRIKSSNTLKAKLKRIRILLMDADGVLTDGRIIYSSDGVEYKNFHVHDGYGISRGAEKGLVFAIISGRTSRVTNLRAKQLGISEVYQGIDNKVDVLNKIKNKYKFQDQEISYIGDDEFDLPLLRKVGFSAAPRDAILRVKKSVDYVTHHDGGSGAVREIVDLILHAKKLI